MKPLKTDDLVVFVHGTFASTEKGWASIEDDFHRNLNLEFYNITGTFFNFTAFPWSGLNSLCERQSAAANLAFELSRQSRYFKRIHLIGHSHGGSVIEIVLQENYTNISKDWIPKLKSWITIGTPFYVYSGNINFTNKKILAVSLSIAVLMVPLITLEGVKLNNWTSGITIFTIFTIIYNFIKAKSLQYQLRISNKMFINLWLGIYSRYDEAIIALKNNINFSLRPKKVKLPTFDVEVNLLNYIINFIGILVDKLILNRIKYYWLSKRLKDYAFGNDKWFYKVKEVNFTPLGSSINHFIPNEIEEFIFKTVLNDNKEKVILLRELINVENVNLLEDMSKFNNEKRPKLIHSDYFEHLGLIQLMAYHIADKSGYSITLPTWLSELKNKIADNC
ncbi:MAG: alpha/beta hydrolase [Saprospiraceae bacterium]|nr:alpha/beta hydrolase [Saprospiraceae bacterium]